MRVKIKLCIQDWVSRLQTQTHTLFPFSHFSLILHSPVIQFGVRLATGLISVWYEWLVCGVRGVSGMWWRVWGSNFRVALRRDNFFTHSYLSLILDYFSLWKDETWYEIRKRVVAEVVWVRCMWSECNKWYEVGSMREYFKVATRQLFLAPSYSYPNFSLILASGRMKINVSLDEGLVLVWYEWEFRWLSGISDMRWINEEKNSHHPRGRESSRQDRRPAYSHLIYYPLSLSS